MTKTCPDCADTQLTFTFGTKGLTVVGNGKCGHCAGTGVEPFDIVDDVLAKFVSIEEEECSVCDGEKECRTCEGLGEVLDDDDKTNYDNNIVSIHDYGGSIERDEDEPTETDSSHSTCYSSSYESYEYDSSPVHSNSSKVHPEFTSMGLPMFILFIIAGMALMMFFGTKYNEASTKIEFVSERQPNQQEIPKSIGHTNNNNEYKGNAELPPVSSNDDTTLYNYASSGHDTSIGKDIAPLIDNEQQTSVYSTMPDASVFSSINPFSTCPESEVYISNASSPYSTNANEKSGVIISNCPVRNITLNMSGRYLVNHVGNITIDPNL